MKGGPIYTMLTFPFPLPNGTINSKNSTANKLALVSLCPFETKTPLNIFFFCGN